MSNLEAKVHIEFPSLRHISRYYTATLTLSFELQTRM